MTQLYETCEEVWDMELTDDHLYSLRDRDLVVQVIYKSDRGNRLKMVRVVEGRSPMCRVNNQVILLSRNGMDINILEDDRAQFPLIGTIKVIYIDQFVSVFYRYPNFRPSQKVERKDDREEQDRWCFIERICK